MTDFDRVRGYRSGAVDYVSVPVVPEILRAKVGVFVELYRKTRQLEELNRELEWRVEQRTAELEASTIALQKSEEHLKLALERLHLALESAGAASWEWDAVRDEMLWTPRYRELYGLDEGGSCKLEGWFSRVHPDDRERLRERIHGVLRTPGDDVWNESFRVDHREHGLRVVNGVGRVLRDPSGIGVRLTGIDVDVTDRVRAEEALREADRRKDEFLATLSHELRNPLAPIQNAVKLLGMPGFGESRSAAARGVIERQLEHLVRLVDDLLDVSRITSGKIALRIAPVDLRGLLERAVETCAPLFEERGVTLRSQAPEAAYQVQGDLPRLVQVVANLLNNAAKYTERGGNVRLLAEVDRDVVVVRVADDGAGIAPDVLPRVFELFARGVGTTPATSDGLGIGLALVRRIVELHGGTVTAHSDGLGKGSEFVVRLPGAIAAATAVVADATPRTSARDGASQRILIADDNDDAAESLALLLEMRGHQVRTARDGVEAVETADAFMPDIVILDIGMPRLDGYDAARQIRQRPWGKAIVLIAQTGWGAAEDRRRSAEAGFDVHLTKPVDLKHLEGVIANGREGR
jgi:two-component system CheB/CheR fusion protein